MLIDSTLKHILKPSRSDEVLLDKLQAKSLRQHGGVGVHAHHNLIWTRMQELELRAANRQLHAHLELLQTSVMKNIPLHLLVQHTSPKETQTGDGARTQRGWSVLPRELQLLYPITTIDKYASSLSESILNHYHDVNQIITRHEAIIRQKEQKKILPLRQYVLLKAYQNMPVTIPIHNCRYAYFLYEVHSQKLRQTKLYIIIYHEPTIRKKQLNRTLLER